MMSSRTSTSRIRGTFSSTHSWSVSKHAAMSGSAEFLFPSTAMRPDSRRPPSTFSSAMLPFAETEPDDLVLELDTKFVLHRAPARFDQFDDVGSARGSVVDDEIRVTIGDAGMAVLDVLQSCAVDQRAGTVGNAVG